ncbi:hypothetical protein AX17_002420 [Amanita inopinata Kibby_2008]|nr:hypothetical protein AX17_002420 [Amanita inopinata Kibby_2008]
MSNSQEHSKQLHAEQSTDEMANLKSATTGFDHVFSNDIAQARQVFASKDDPFHLLGLGACAFLEAALGMESVLMEEASRCLAASEAGSKKQLREIKYKQTSRFPPGLEWEILLADATVLSGLTHALSESYMGYIQCLYALNSAHSKFARLYKTVFPHGLDGHDTPTHLREPSSNISLHSAPPTPRSGLFGRLTGSIGPSGALTPNIPPVIRPEGPVEELIVAGTAFGYGLFNLVFSLLPKKVQRMVGFFGFKYDRKLALHALSVAAAKSDSHSVFAGLVLMSYWNIVLFMSGWQGNREKLMKEYRAINEPILARYPTGSLWSLNRAKILRLSNDPEGAIAVLQEGIRPGRVHLFKQADTLLVFELAWTLLGQQRYQEAAEMFQKMKEMNSWSHATYHFISAGCYISVGNLDKAQELFDAIPDLIGKKVAGRSPPTEVFVKTKIEFYKEKQRRRGGSEARFVEAIKISPAEEIGIFWNNHAHVSPSIARDRINKFLNLSPPIVSPPSRVSSVHTDSPSPSTGSNSVPAAITNAAPEAPVDLDTPDELAIRSLLLGINYRTAGDYATAHHYLTDAHAQRANINTNTWVAGISMFELAVLDLRELDAKMSEQPSSDGMGDGILAAAVTTALEDLKLKEGGDVGDSGTGQSLTLQQQEWANVLKAAEEKLDQALAWSPQSVDLSSRLDSRISMLKEEIATKREMLGIVG